MTVKDLVKRWEDEAYGDLTKEAYQVNLSLEDAAKLDALSEMYPKRTKEQLITELLSAALSELESSFPYIAGAKVISQDEMGDPMFEDVGPTPAFINLTKKHLAKLRAGSSN
ncbi:type 1 pili tip component [Teredinibacter sp. KSP-S5-2]|uniref:type 1 pili tip component n=1 Tax=Teredinibacter sp. KSP-S5-2 TaxID=3034506 RepID=UPI0029347EC8|nr:type 1 pili tip component [Teredinibacter sp. KSP-S5-2]WNO08005.1 type 1 pili tip component [Teredinibacter sp. KSP-S5-2]